MDRVSVRDILFQLTEKVPSTARYVRSVMNIANYAEPLAIEVLSGDLENESRFSFYMRLISENSETFRVLQE